MRRDTVAKNEETKDMLCDAVLRKKQLSTENITRVLCQWNKISRKTKKKMECKWIENITEWIGLKINEAVRITKDRHRGHNVPLTANALGGRH